jgi:uncharacterized membrane protein YbhN (UPF0104 family)
MDGLTVVALLAGAAMVGGFTTQTTVGPFTLGALITGTTAVFGAILVLAIAAVHWPAVARASTHAIAGALLPKRWAEKPVAILDGLLDGLDVLRDWRRFAAVSVLSLGVWGVNGLSFWFGLEAFNIDTPFTAAFILQSLIAFGVALPSSPGFFGPFEAVTRATLSLYGVAGGLAVSFAVGYHLLTFLPITVLGLWSLTRARLHLTDLRHAADAPQAQLEGTPAQTP